jgi:hypothetical protein
MESAIKKATNISRNRPAEPGVESGSNLNEIFEEPWDEMVIRFDKNSHQFVVKRVIGPAGDEQIRVVHED